jgi:hypothetical protein
MFSNFSNFKKLLFIALLFLSSFFIVDLVYSQGCIWISEYTCPASAPYPSSCSVGSCHFTTGGSGIQTTCSQYIDEHVVQITTCNQSQTTDQLCAGAGVSGTTYAGEISCSFSGSGPSCGNGTCEPGENGVVGSPQYCAADCGSTGYIPPPPTGGGSGGLVSLSTSFLPFTRSIENGQTTTYTVDVAVSNLNSGGSALVLLTLSGCPSGATCTLSGGNTMNFDSNMTKSTVLVVTANTVTASTYNLQVVTSATTAQGANTDTDTSSLVVTATAPSGNNPTTWIDVPADSSTVSGNVYIAGWAIDNATSVETAISSVKVLIDGSFVGNATPYSRPDVCIAYPGRTGCPNVGYEYTWDSRTVSNGSHTIRFEATDSDTTSHTSGINRLVNVNNVSSGTILGYKIDASTGSPSGTQASQTVSLNGGSPQTSNPYFLNGITPGNNNTVSVTVPSGWTVGYTLCYGNINCHGNAPTPGSSVVVNIPVGLPQATNYADLWWHYTPPAVVNNYTVTVNKTVGGKVDTVDTKISCGSDCSEVYSQGTVITLVATPSSAQWKFVGWQGACTGIGNCSLTVNGPKFLSAKFAPRPFQYQEF